MLGPIRKFSGTLYAKILLGIIIIPFIFFMIFIKSKAKSMNFVDDFYRSKITEHFPIPNEIF